VLEPQREIKESYEAVELSLQDGRKLTGYIVARDASGVTLREPATGAETKLAPADVAAERAIGSFMPPASWTRSPAPTSATFSATSPSWGSRSRKRASLHR